MLIGTAGLKNVLGATAGQVAPNAVEATQKFEKNVAQSIRADDAPADPRLAAVAAGLKKKWPEFASEPDADVVKAYRMSDPDFASGTDEEFMTAAQSVFAPDYKAPGVGAMLGQMGHAIVRDMVQTPLATISNRGRTHVYEQIVTNAKNELAKLGPHSPTESGDITVRRAELESKIKNLLPQIEEGNKDFEALAGPMTGLTVGELAVLGLKKAPIVGPALHALEAAGKTPAGKEATGRLGRWIARRALGAVHGAAGIGGWEGGKAAAQGKTPGEIAHKTAEGAVVGAVAGPVLGTTFEAAGAALRGSWNAATKALGLTAQTINREVVGNIRASIDALLPVDIPLRFNVQDAESANDAARRILGELYPEVTDLDQWLASPEGAAAFKRLADKIEQGRVVAETAPTLSMPSTNPAAPPPASLPSTIVNKTTGKDTKIRDMTLRSLLREEASTPDGPLREAFRAELSRRGVPPKAAPPVTKFVPEEQPAGVAPGTIGEVPGPGTPLSVGEWHNPLTGEGEPFRPVEGPLRPLGSSPERPTIPSGGPLFDPSQPYDHVLTTEEAVQHVMGEDYARSAQARLSPPLHTVGNTPTKDLAEVAREMIAAIARGEMSVETARSSFLQLAEQTMPPEATNVAWGGRILSPTEWSEGLWDDLVNHAVDEDPRLRAPLFEPSVSEVGRETPRPPAPPAPESPFGAPRPASPSLLPTPEPATNRPGPPGGHLPPTAPMRTMAENQAEAKAADLTEAAGRVEAAASPDSPPVPRAPVEPQPPYPAEAIGMFEDPFTTDWHYSPAASASLQQRARLGANSLQAVTEVQAMGDPAMTAAGKLIEGRRVANGVELEVTRSADGTALELHHLRNVGETKGAGAQALNEVLASADRHQVPVTTRAMPIAPKKGGRIPLPKLVAYFEKHGFTTVAKNADGSVTMLRLPKPVDAMSEAEAADMAGTNEQLKAFLLRLDRASAKRAAGNQTPGAPLVRAEGSTDINDGPTWYRELFDMVQRAGDAAEKRINDTLGGREMLEGLTSMPRLLTDLSFAIAARMFRSGDTSVRALLEVMKQWKIDQAYATITPMSIEHHRKVYASLQRAYNGAREIVRRMLQNKLGGLPPPINLFKPKLPQNSVSAKLDAAIAAFDARRARPAEPARNPLGRKRDEHILRDRMRLPYKAENVRFFLKNYFGEDADIVATLFAIHHGYEPSYVQQYNSAAGDLSIILGTQSAEASWRKALNSYAKWKLRLPETESHPRIAAHLNAFRATGEFDVASTAPALVTTLRAALMGDDNAIPITRALLNNLGLLAIRTVPEGQKHAPRPGALTDIPIDADVFEMARALVKDLVHDPSRDIFDTEPPSPASVALGYGGTIKRGEAISKINANEITKFLDQYPGRGPTRVTAWLDRLRVNRAKLDNAERVINEIKNSESTGGTLDAVTLAPITPPNTILVSIGTRVFDEKSLTKLDLFRMQELARKYGLKNHAVSLGYWKDPALGAGKVSVDINLRLPNTPQGEAVAKEVGLTTRQYAYAKFTTKAAEPGGPKPETAMEFPSTGYDPEVHGPQFLFTGHDGKDAELVEKLKMVLEVPAEPMSSRPLIHPPITQTYGTEGRVYSWQPPEEYFAKNSWGVVDDLLDFPAGNAAEAFADHSQRDLVTASAMLERLAPVRTAGIEGHLVATPAGVYELVNPTEANGFKMLEEVLSFTEPGSMAAKLRRIEGRPVYRGHDIIARLRSELGVLSSAQITENKKAWAFGKQVSKKLLAQIFEQGTITSTNMQSERSPFVKHTSFWLLPDGVLVKLSSRIHARDAKVAMDALKLKPKFKYEGESGWPEVQAVLNAGALRVQVTGNTVAAHGTVPLTPAQVSALRTMSRGKSFSGLHDSPTGTVVGYHTGLDNFILSVTRSFPELINATKAAKRGK